MSGLTSIKYFYTFNTWSQFSPSEFKDPGRVEWPGLFLCLPVRRTGSNLKATREVPTFMAWIESHETLGQHPKVHSLCTALNVEIPTAIGILHLLWHFTLKFAWRDGDLSKYTNDVIAKSVYWKGDADTLIKALESSNWLNNRVVHDWMDYAGKIINDRLYNELRRKTSLNADIPRKSTATNQPTVPTKPNTYAQNASGVVVDNFSFETFWKAYPKRIGKGNALKVWRRLKPDKSLLERILVALEAQIGMVAWEKDGGQFIPHPATWLNGRRWEDEIKDIGGKDDWQR